MAMRKQTSYVLLPQDGEPLAFPTRREAADEKRKLKGSAIYDVVIYTDDSLNTGNKKGNFDEDWT